MSRYIDADEFKNQVALQAAAGTIDTLQAEAMCKIIDLQPTADVEPVRHAHWEIQEYEFLTCSDCGESYYTGCDCTSEAKEKLEDGDCYNYCPCCGAKMDESVGK